MELMQSLTLTNQEPAATLQQRLKIRSAILKSCRYKDEYLGLLTADTPSASTSTTLPSRPGNGACAKVQYEYSQYSTYHIAPSPIASQPSPTLPHHRGPYRSY